MTTSLEQAVAHIKAGNTEEGKRLLAEIIRQNPRDENAWLWMSRCVTQPEQKRYCFDRVLKINPQNQHAIEGLRRLTSPPPLQGEPKPTEAQPRVLPRSRKNNGLALVLGGVLLIAFVCACGLAYLAARTPSPTQAARLERPNYGQMLEANGFEYFMSDNEGNPSYSSPCGAMAVVRPDSVGFAVSHSSDNNCGASDIGRIVSVMYPSEVLDNVVTSMNLLDEFDQMITRTAVGYEISVVLTEYEHTLLVVIKDPR